MPQVGWICRWGGTHIFTNFDLVATPARKEDAVASLHAGGDDFALLVGRTGADGNDSRFRKRTCGRGGGDEDARGGFLSSTEEETRACQQTQKSQPVETGEI